MVNAVEKKAETVEEGDSRRAAMEWTPEKVWRLVGEERVGALGRPGYESRSQVLTVQ